MRGDVHGRSGKVALPRVKLIPVIPAFFKLDVAPDLRAARAVLLRKSVVAMLDISLEALLSIVKLVEELGRESEDKEHAYLRLMLLPLGFEAPETRPTSCQGLGHQSAGQAINARRRVFDYRRGRGGCP